MHTTIEPKTPTPGSLTPERAERLRAALRERYFNWDDPGYFGSETFKFDLEQHVSGRYRECASSVVPWVNRLRPLRGARIIEIGCGTGSSTAAFGEVIGPEGTIDAYDINEPSVNAARARMEIFGLSNATFHVVQAESLTTIVRQHNPHGADIMVCYAVLEHQTLAERMDTIAAAWDLLRPGGLFVVGDSPNRLTWMDHHTSTMPYFDCLPDDLAILYAHKSPRAEFVKQFPEVKRDVGADGVSRWRAPDAAMISRLARWGRGISYHEFELVLGDLQDLVVGDSLDPEILNSPHHEISLEEKMLFAFAASHTPNVPPAFLRASIEVVLRKPGGENPSPALRRAIPPVSIG
ncbi:hypothetical protein PHYC_01796 [Phycisphaerales bacterium]|nr:hypothetical protein PHYC_01796 [Phycisphaerales bacterium]